MAKILYEVKKNQNTSSSAYGKWFAQIKTLETLNTRKLASHISEHGSIIASVITALSTTSCLGYGPITF